MSEKVTIVVFGRQQDYARKEAINIFLNAYYSEQGDDKEKYDYVVQALISGYTKINADKRISS